MKTTTIFPSLENNRLNSFELNSIRGGESSGGTTIPIDEDILLPDPEPDEETAD